MSVAAFFDIDGTITKTTIIHPLLWYARSHLSRPRFARLLVSLLLHAPYYWWLDHRSRSRFNVVFYRRYAGLNMAALRAWHEQAFAATLQPTIFPAARACIQAHQEQGHRIVLVTGGLYVVMQPLAAYLHADELIATRLLDRDGVCTGAIDGPPIADARKAALVHECAIRSSIDLASSFAYGNSMGDAPMLECVGNPVAVNPDGRLRRLATARGWKVAQWC